MFFAVSLETTGDLEIFLEREGSAGLLFLVEKVVVRGEVADTWTNVFCFLILFNFLAF